MAETDFLPWLARYCVDFANLSKPAEFAKFYARMNKTHYFNMMRSVGIHISEREWYGLCTSYTAAELFETLIRQNTDVAPGSGKIWGDKSPSYIGHIPLLKKLYPHSKIIHVVRDVRDYCLSINRAWGKSPLRAAHRWAELITAAEDARLASPEDVILVRYEDLLASPEQELSRVCAFIGIEFESSMLQLQSAVENLGSARGLHAIKIDNANKYLTMMRPELRRRIESICWPVLENLEYPFDYSGPPQPLGSIHLGLLKAYDALKLIRFQASQHGLLTGARAVWRRYALTGQNGRD